MIKGTLYRYAATLVRVVDGDTLVLEIDLGFNIRTRQHVRLFGVDTPEISGKKASPEGRAAVVYVTAWFEGDPQLYIHSHFYDDRDKYGRVLATIYRRDDPVPLNDALIYTGHGSAL